MLTDQQHQDRLRTYHRILKLKWMNGLPKRVQNVIAAYGSDQKHFTKSTLIADIKSGIFLQTAINPGPKTVDIIENHFGIATPKETITGVAVRANGKLYKLPKPNRHHHVLGLIHKETKKEVFAEEEGFITSLGRYVNRKEAYRIAKAANQFLPRHFNSGELYSECVW